jgi:hypothetical protein
MASKDGRSPCEGCKVTRVKLVGAGDSSVATTTATSDEFFGIVKREQASAIAITMGRSRKTDCEFIIRYRLQGFVIQRLEGRDSPTKAIKPKADYIANLVVWSGVVVE